MRITALAGAACLAMVVGGSALAQGAPASDIGPPAYGPPITLDQAKRAAAAAEAEAARRNVRIVIAIAGPTGELVYFEHMDGALYASDDLAKLKAANSARYRWATSHFAAMLKNPGQAFPDVFVGDGGMPLVVGGKVVGAIGVSGADDSAIAQKAVDALK